MEYKVNISYLNESNEIVCDTQDMQLRFKLSDYYNGLLFTSISSISTDLLKDDIMTSV
ncbi:MAG: hypothetical protein K0R69_736 [Clostridia bacterium]|jgi:hypothetical protein|nr:hypothetical protein [Clostridia bacterium]